ncbi:four helix bundle protein [Nitratifractor sp.]|uniref:four helix bundle protein n=1 Tax=Nitratifractor sp. TaxID=2268144 RepID=UPI0025F16117|nr:four helix bundle protein [Nitratifractor sp.]
MRNEEPKRNDPLSDKSFAFALRIIRLGRFLKESHKEYIISKQVLRSGTSIGALIAEGKYAQSKADFLHKLTIALKEASETEYWLRLLKESRYIDDTMFQSLYKDLDELLRLLIASTKTIKQA